MLQDRKAELIKIKRLISEIQNAHQPNAEELTVLEEKRKSLDAIVRAEERAARLKEEIRKPVEIPFHSPILSTFYDPDYL